jgi:glycosyltransferase involved in cell wall biosynthesis
VDDGSSDNTDEVVGKYVEKDSRFKYYHRPNEHLPGGNGARNYGFKMSQGEYIQWFDSDDLMVPKKLERKLEFMINHSLDMVVSNTVNFHPDKTNSRPYDLNYDLLINPENFISQCIGWITNDALIKKSIISIKFNEKVKSGQEYNFFSRLLFCDLKVDYIKKDLSMRRMHDNSIQTNLQSDNIQKKKELVFNELLLLNDIYSKAPKSVKNRAFKRIFRFSLETTNAFRMPAYKKQIFKFMLNKNEFVFLRYFSSWLILNLLTGKGYFVFKKYSNAYH